MSGHVICLENQPKTIQDQISIIRKYHLQEDICEKPLQLGNLLESNTFKEEPIKAFILDMHDSNVRNLAEIRLPNVDTSKGEAVGLAVAEKYLKTPTSRFRDIPVAFLTGYEIHPPVMKRIENLSQRYGDVVTLYKKDDLARFETFIRKLVGSGDPIKMPASTKKTENSVEIADYQEGFKISLEILSKLRLSNIEKAAMFGTLLTSEDQWITIADNIRAAAGINTDVRHRCELIIDMKTGLDAIIGRRALNSQREWLRAPLDVLSRKSPIDLLKTSELFDLARIVGILRNVTG